MLKGKFFYIAAALIIVAIGGYFYLHQEPVKPVEVAIHQLYFEPYGQTCNLSEKIIKEIITEHPEIKINFDVVNIDLPENQKYKDDYKINDKAVIIASEDKKDKFVVSRIRELIKYGLDETEVKKSFIREIKSISCKNC